MKEETKFMCALGDCNSQCFTCSEDEKCDNLWPMDNFGLGSNFCPQCKSTDLIDIDDHYTRCNNCNFSFVG